MLRLSICDIKKPASETPIYLMGCIMKKALTVLKVIGEMLVGAFLVNLFLGAALQEAWLDNWIACLAIGLVLGWPIYQVFDALMDPHPGAINPWVEAVFRAKDMEEASRISPPTPVGLAIETLRLRRMEQRLKR